MNFTHKNFTLSYHQAREHQIDCNDYTAVKTLPENVQFYAVAGVWGKFVNIRCLFKDADGNLYHRNIYKRDEGYMIKELGVDAKAIEVGQVFQINNAPS